MTDESAKKAILARRARFIAAAMMSAGLASCESTPSNPAVCLKIKVTSPDTAPTPCLSTPVPLPDAGATVSDGGPDDAGALDAGPADAGPADAGAPRKRTPPIPPAVCLSQRPPEPPRPRPSPEVCLSYLPFDPPDKP